MQQAEPMKVNVHKIHLKNSIHFVSTNTTIDEIRKLRQNNKKLWNQLERETNQSALGLVEGSRIAPSKVSISYKVIS